MSSVNAPFGFQPIYHASGFVRPAAFTLANNAAVTLLQNQPVKLSTDGVVVPATVGDAFVGTFQGVEFMSTRGPIGIFVDRFCQDDRIYFLNDNFIERHHRPDFGWFDDDGTVFLRTADSDDYEARYGGYYQNYIVPTAHGCLYGLAV